MQFVSSKHMMFAVRCLGPRLACLVVALCLWAVAASAQCEVSGTVVDASDGSALPGASVVAFVGDSAQVGSSSGPDGKFRVTKIGVGRYSIRVSFIGYEPYSVDVVLSRVGEKKDVGRLTLKPVGKNIDEVTVVSQVARQEQRGDTTIFNAGAYKVNPDATTEDLLRKMPGMTVKDGSVSHGGESVKKVLVDGKEFFGNDPSAALKNIDASMVDKIEVFDKQSEQAEFTGFSDGKEEKTINILTKQGVSKGVFGRAAAGYGTSDHFELEGVAHLFSGETRLSLIGSFNDVDKMGFSAPGGGGGGGGGTGKNKNASVGLNYGYENEKKLRVESSYVFAYRDNSVTSEKLQEYFQADGADSTHTYSSSNESANTSRSHRVTMRLRWIGSDINTFVFSPSFNWNGGSSSNSSDGVDMNGMEAYSQTSQAADGDNSSWSFSGNFTWRHKMSVPKRTISISLRSSLSRSSSDAMSRGGMTDGDSNPGGDGTAPDKPDGSAPDQPDGTTAPSDTEPSGELPPTLPDGETTVGALSVVGQQTNSKGKGFSLSTRLVYTEPFGDHWAASVNYEPSYSSNSNNKSVLADTVYTTGDAADVTFSNLTFSPTLSNDMESRYLIHRAGLAFNALLDRRIRGSVGLDVQEAILEGEQTYPIEFSTRRTFFSLMPSLELFASNSSGLNLKFRYRTSSSAPSITDLQDVVDVSDVRRYSVGNPSLKQSVTHNMNLALMRNNKETSRSIFLISNFSVTNGFAASSSIMASADSVLASGVILPAGTQLTMPVNLDGRLSASVNLNMSTPISKFGCNASLSVGANFQKTPGFFEGTRITSRNSSVNMGLSLGSAFSEVVDFNVSYNPSYSVVRSTRAVESNYDYYGHSIRADINTLFFNNHFVVSSTISHNYSQGMGDGFDNNYVSWNAAMAYKFLARRQAEVRLRVNDILDSNKSSSRSVQDAYVQTSSSNVLRRYAMLTFTYKFNEMAGRNNNGRGGDRRGGMGGLPMGGGPGGGPGGGMGGPPPM